MKKAFSMIELVFVIVVMGIIAGAFLEPTLSVYSTYLKTKSISELISDSESTSEFIINKLKYINRSSIIIRHSDDSYEALTDSDDIKLFEWLPYDIDGFTGNDKPYWSGLINLQDTNKTHIEILSSDLDKANEMIKSLGSASFNDGVIYFIGGRSDIDGFAWDGNAITENNESIYPIEADGNNIKPKFSDFSGLRITEMFGYSWTANGLGLEDGDLYFYTDYRPWNGETYKDGSKTLLQKDISTFKIKKRESLLWIEVCVKNGLLKDEYAICRERLVF